MFHNEETVLTAPQWWASAKVVHFAMHQWRIQGGGTGGRCPGSVLSLECGNLQWDLKATSKLWPPHPSTSRGAWEFFISTLQKIDGCFNLAKVISVAAEW